MNKIIMTLSSIKYGKGFKSCDVVLFRNNAGKGGIVIGNNVSMNSGVIACTIPAKAAEACKLRHEFFEPRNYRYYKKVCNQIKRFRTGTLLTSKRTK